MKGREIVKSADTVEEAINLAVEQLGVPKESIDFEILEEPKTGILGFGARPARVRVFVKTSEDEQLILEAVTKVGKILDPSFRVESLEKEGGRWIANVTAQDLGIILGIRGRILDAIETVAQAILAVSPKGRIPLTLDAKGFRERRKVVLQKAARDAAERVKHGGEPVVLEPMSARERKIVHETIKEIEGVESFSEGRGNDRHVTIRKVGAVGGDRSERREPGHKPQPESSVTTTPVSQSQTPVRPGSRLSAGTKRIRRRLRR